MNRTERISNKSLMFGTFYSTLIYSKSGKIRVVTRPQRPSGVPVVSPDGRRIAFTSNANGSQQIYIKKSKTLLQGRCNI